MGYLRIDLRGIFIVRGCVLRSSNCHGQNTTEPTKEYCQHNNNCKLWLPPHLNNGDISDKYELRLWNKFDALEEKTETYTPNDEYENFVNAHLETVAECTPTKQWAKPRVPWETLDR